MMNLAFFTGFFLGLSLIIAIGAQNAFVLRQGILRQHVFYIALFCSIADTVLIILGIAGFSYFFNDFINGYSKIIFGIASLWLFIYGLLRLKSLFRTNSAIITSNKNSSNLQSKSKPKPRWGAVIGSDGRQICLPLTEGIPNTGDVACGGGHCLCFV